jgi:hypothetical protein
MIERYNCNVCTSDFFEVDTIESGDGDIYFSIMNFENGEEINNSVCLTRMQVVDIIAKLQKELNE